MVVLVVTLWCGMWGWPDCKDLWAQFTKAVFGNLFQNSEGVQFWTRNFLLCDPDFPTTLSKQMAKRSLHLKDLQCRVTSTGFRSTCELQVSSLLPLGHPTLFGTSSGFGLEPRPSKDSFLFFDVYGCPVGKDLEDCIPGCFPSIFIYLDSMYSVLDGAILHCQRSWQFSDGCIQLFVRFMSFFHRFWSCVTWICVLDNQDTLKLHWIQQRDRATANP